MALSAGRLDIPCRQDRLLPCQRTPVGFFDSGRRALPTVTHHAAVLIQRMWNRRVLAERLRADVRKARFLQSDVAAGAAINDSKLRQPDLLDSIVVVEAAFERDRISAAPNQRQILLLIMTPFTEMVLSRRNSQRNQ